MDTPSPKRLSLALICGFALLANSLALPVLFGHRSSPATILGYYSLRYALVLLIALSITGLWGGAFIFRKQLEPQLNRLSPLVRAGLMAFGCVVVLLLLPLPIEAHVLAYFGMNTCLALVLISLPVTGLGQGRYWLLLLICAFLVYLPLSFLTHVYEQPYHPDDAHWADAASTFWLEGGLYTRSWQQTPLLISPGIGWVNALYGWLLVNVDFDIAIGRTLRFSTNIATAIGMGLVMGKVYGRRSAYLTIALILVTAQVLMDGSYRPNTFVTAWTFYMMALMLLAREKTGKQALILHSLVGLGVTLAMQLHAIAFGLALGVSAFYLGECLLRWRKQGLKSLLPPLITYGVGALLGTVIFYLANVVAIGGFDVYLGTLVDSRYSSERSLDWLSPPLIQQTLILAAWLFLLWRRSPADKRLMSLIACIFAATFLIDTQGYDAYLLMLLSLPIAEVLVAGLGAENGSARRLLWAATSILLVTGSIYLYQEMHWELIHYVVANRTLPERDIILIGEAIQERVEEDEVLVTTHEVLWTFWQYPHFISYAAESTFQARMGYAEPIQVWETLAPDVIVDLPARIVTPDGLADYRAQYFSLCEQLTVRGFDIFIYRRVCNASL